MTVNPSPTPLQITRALQVNRRQDNLRQIYDFLYGVGRWFRRYMMLIVLAAIVGAVLGFYIQSRKVLLYPSALSFMVNEKNSGGGGGALSGIAGQLGISVPGGKDGLNLDRIIALSKSSDIVWQALIDTSLISGRPESLLDMILEAYALEIEELEPYLTRKEILDAIDNTYQGRPQNTQEAAALRVVLGQAGSPGLYSVIFDDDSGILTINTLTKSPEISDALCYAIYRKIQEYYSDQASSQPQLVYRKAVRHTDSIRSVLNSKELQLARVRDSEQAMLLRQDEVSKDRLQREISIMSILYAEAVKNLENAKFMLSGSVPTFQILETPTLFETPPPRGRVAAAVVGGLVGLILGLALAFIHFLLKEMKAATQRQTVTNSTIT